MKVNIIGCAPGWDDESSNDGFVWGVNDIHLLRDVDVVVDCHNLEKVAAGDEKTGRRTKKDIIKHMRILKEKGIPLYTTALIKDIPNSIKYPLEEIIKEFDSDYFASGIDYAIALAVYKGATEIHLYGVLMFHESEYAHQKPSVEHWLGISKGRGIKTKVHGNFSTILKTQNSLLYGYNRPQSFVNDTNPEFAVYENFISQLEKKKALASGLGL